MKNIVAALVISLLISNIALANGLRFKGSEVIINERSSMDINLSPLGLISRSAKDKIELSFDMQVYNDTPSGYVFELNAGKDKELVMFYDGVSAQHNFAIIWKYHRFVINCFIPKSEFDPSQKWIKLDIVVDISKDIVELCVNDKYHYEGNFELASSIRPKIRFGKTEYLIDIPSFAIRNLSISVDQKSFGFKLVESSGRIAESYNSFAYARISSPVWLADEFMHWNKVYSHSSDSFQSTSYDINNHEVFTFDETEIHYYNVSSSSDRMQSFANPCPTEPMLGMSFIHDNNIYAYELYYPGELKGLPSLAVLDTDKYRWSILSHEVLNMQMHHHCQYLDSATFYIFGGFGNRRLNGGFYLLDLHSKTWSRRDLQGETVWPRYFAGMGYDEQRDKLLIFGGQGNESGDQVVGKQYLYDLHEVDLSSMSCRKLWDARWDGKNCVVARNMIIIGDKFYALCYPETVTNSTLQLYEFDINDGSYKTLADTLSIYSDRITSNANLYYDKDIEKLIAIVEESSDDISSKVSVYTLSFPSINSGHRLISKRIILLIVLAVLVLGLIFASIIYYHRLKRHSSANSFSYKRLEPIAAKPSSILLFGHFTVIDKNGNDISASFTDKLKQLLILILQNNDKGISSKKLSSSLWAYKEEQKAKNIRGVTISKLRSKLKDLDGISLVYEEGYFRFVIDERLYCDYLEFNKALSGEYLDAEKAICIASRGKFLISETEPIFDMVKDNVEINLESVINAQIAGFFESKDYANVLLCTKILNHIDPLNEEALRYSIKSLLLTHNPAEAKSKYQEYITRYKKEYAESFSLSFEELSA